MNFGPWSLAAAWKPPPVYKSSYRPWNVLDKSEFRSFLLNSKFSQLQNWTSLDSNQLASLYNSSISSILGQLVPQRLVTLRSRPSDLWFDKEYHGAKKKIRHFERLYHRAKSSGDSLISILLFWRNAYRSYRRMLREKKQQFWSNQIDSNSVFLRALRQILNKILSRGQSLTPTGVTADAFESDQWHFVFYW